jgi:lysophospholipid acyltransferase (LPLAT)-like uncharacterized protein
MLRSMLKGARRRLARMGPILLFQLARTWRIRIEGELPTSAAVIAFWHGDMLPVWKHFSETRSIAVISQSRDGGLLADLVGRWGFQTVRGSSSKDGKRVLAEMVNAARAGRQVLITPDGPRGPHQVMKIGALIAAHRAGIPLVLARVSCSRAVHGSHWDRFLIPLPFAKIEIDFATLIIPPDADRDTLDRLNLYAETLLRRLTPLL